MPASAAMCLDPKWSGRRGGSLRVLCTVERGLPTSSSIDLRMARVPSAMPCPPSRARPLRPRASSTGRRPATIRPVDVAAGDQVVSVTSAGRRDRQRLAQRSVLTRAGLPSCFRTAVLVLAGPWYPGPVRPPRRSVRDRTPGVPVRAWPGRSSTPPRAPRTSLLVSVPPGGRPAERTSRSFSIRPPAALEL